MAKKRDAGTQMVANAVIRGDLQYCVMYSRWTRIGCDYSCSRKCEHMQLRNTTEATNSLTRPVALYHVVGCRLYRPFIRPSS